MMTMCPRFPFFSPLLFLWQSLLQEKVWELPVYMCCAIVMCCCVPVCFNISLFVCSFLTLNMSVCCFLLQTPWSWKHRPRLSGAVHIKVWTRTHTHTITATCCFFALCRGDLCVFFALFLSSFTTSQSAGSRTQSVLQINPRTKRLTAAVRRLVAPGA